MATVMMVDTPNMTAEQYEATVTDMGLTDSLPAGCTARIAGQAPDGMSWRVITVWDDIAAAGRFVTEKLLPAQRRAGIKPSTSAQSWELHNMVV